MDRKIINDGTLDLMNKIKEIRESDFFHNIWQFRETMLICEQPQRISNGIVKQLWVPYMCLCSFVCELEIKYICYYVDNKLLKSHDLEYLFKQLPEIIKEKIMKTFLECKFNFEKKLHDYSLIFEQWRYKYEYIPIETIDKRFLKIFEMLLYEEITNYRNLNGFK